MSANEIVIYHGFWQNHDYPFPFSLTLTISTRWGNNLIAALSTLVAWAGIAFYGIVAYFIHQYYATKKNRDLLDHQLQVLFRSESGALESAVESLQLLAAWRKTAKRATVRVLPFAASAVALWVGFIVASVLVADVASESYGDVTVLAIPKYCGDIDFGPPGAWDTQLMDKELEEEFRKSISARSTYLHHNIKWARTYAHAHYSTGSLANTNMPPASRSRRRTLPIKKSDVECPWKGETRCLGYNMTEGPALEMDTGLLDSHADLGINARPDNRVQFRKKATCAVIDTTKFDTSFTVENMTMYGINILAEDQENPYLPDELKRAVAWQKKDRADGIFTASWHYRWANPNKIKTPDGNLTGLNLIPTFQNHDHDVVFWTIAAFVIYFDEVLDPLFFANISVGGEYYGEAVTGDIAYTPNRPYNTAACKDSYEVCNPENGACTGTVGIHELADFEWAKLGFNRRQVATAARLAVNAYWGGQLFHNGPLGTTGLIMQDAHLGEGAAPARDQWKREASMWFATALSNFQMVIVDWSTKPWLDEKEEALGKYVNQTALDQPYGRIGVLDEKRELCGNTILRTSASLQNFSVFGTGVVIATTVFIILLKISLPALVSWFRARRKAPSAKAAERETARDADDKYQLLRMALEGSGVTGWRIGRFGMPVTKRSREIITPLRDPVRKLARYPTFPTYPGFSPTSTTRSPPRTQGSWSTVGSGGTITQSPTSYTTVGGGSPTPWSQGVVMVKSPLDTVATRPLWAMRGVVVQERQASSGSDSDTSGSSGPGRVPPPWRAGTWVSTEKSRNGGFF